jgi:uncharacterized membrane protein
MPSGKNKMTNISRLLAIGVGSLTTISATAETTVNNVGVPVPPQPKAWEQCYGIARSGFNECAALDGAHQCGGAEFTDGDPNEWMWVPKGWCEKIVGGTTVSITVHKAKVKKQCLKYQKKNGCKK